MARRLSLLSFTTEDTILYREQVILLTTNHIHLERIRVPSISCTKIESNNLQKH